MHKDDQPDWVKRYRQAVGDRIRTRRTEVGLTQIEVAVAAGVDRTTYQLIERGESDPRLGDLALIADQLQCDVSALTQVEIPPA